MRRCLQTLEQLSLKQEEWGPLVIGQGRTGPGWIQQKVYFQFFSLIPILLVLFTDRLGTGGGIMRDSSCRGREGSVAIEFSAILNFKAFSENCFDHILVRGFVLIRQGHGKTWYYYDNII